MFWLVFYNYLSSYLILLDYEQLFHNCCNIKDSMHESKVSDVGRWAVRGRLYIPIAECGAQ